LAENYFRQLRRAVFWPVAIGLTAVHFIRKGVTEQLVGNPELQASTLPEWLQGTDKLLRGAAAP